MAADVRIQRFTGSGAGSGTDINGINTRANAEDAHSTAGTSNPVRIPTSGSNYSFWVSTRLKAQTSPSGTINNLRWFTDGSNNFGTGITCVGQAANVGANAGYRQATGTAGTTGDVLNTSNHTGLTGAPVDVFTFTSGSPKSLSGSITNPSTGVFGDFFVYQIVVGTTASAGASAQETFTFRWDES